jgi:tetratricopeptide (TPR) repeat protein
MVALLPAAPARAQAAPAVGAKAPTSGGVEAAASAQLAAGIAAVQAGDYQPAVSALSSALRGLAQDPAREADLVRAYLHLGVAFAGLGQDSPARSQFTQALLRRPEATLEVKNAPESARRIFQEARAEAAPVIAAADERKKKGSKLPLVLAGVAAVGAGVGVASAGGGGDSGPPPTTGPISPGPAFRFASITGNPFMSFGDGQPASGTTIQVGSVQPRFMYRVQFNNAAAPAGPFARLQASVDLVTLERVPCWHADSAIFSLSAGEIVQLVVDAFPPTPSCAAPFNTLTVEAKLFDREAARQVSATVYSGGYKVVP